MSVKAGPGSIFFLKSGAPPVATQRNLLTAAAALKSLSVPVAADAKVRRPCGRCRSCRQQPARDEA